MKRGQIIFSLCFGVLALLFSQAAFAEEVYKFPEITPEIHVNAGYRFTGLKGSERASEYEYLHDSTPFGGKLVAFPFPHRVHLELDFTNRNVYFGDISYAYRDIVLSRWIDRTFFHNLDNLTVVSTATDIRDAGESYGVKAGLNDLFLRLKTPHFPFHVYIIGHLLDKKGSSQQRFLGGSGWYRNKEKVSQKRDVDWNTQIITVGANSHLGPLELDISHSKKSFDSSGDRFMTYSYGIANTSGGTLIRPAGTYPHNLIPDSKGSTTTLKLHTSYTGKIVGSVTLSKTERENKDSSAKADYFTGAGELRWIPFPRLAFIFKYRHRERKVDNPDTLQDGYYGLSTNPTIITGIKPSISSKVDTLSGNLRYRIKRKHKLLRSLTLNLGYTYKKTDRTYTEQWSVLDRTEDNALVLSATARLRRGLKLKLRYKHRNISRPAYSIQPDRSDGGALSLTWKPIKKFTAFLSYNITFEQRDGISLSTITADREVRKDRFITILTFLIKKHLILTTSYAYLHKKVQQDLMYGGYPVPEPPDYDAQHKDTASNLTANLSYTPKEKINLNAGVSSTLSKGETSFSEVKLNETTYNVSAEHSLRGGWSLGLRYKHIDFNNLTDNPDVSDGTVNITFLTVSRKWH